MGCFTQPMSAMGDLLVGPAIILLLIHVSSVQETPQVPYTEGVPQSRGTPLSLYKCPKGAGEWVEYFSISSGCLSRAGMSLSAS